MRNFAVSTLASGLASGATNLIVAPGTGSRFDDPEVVGPYNLVVWNARDFFHPWEAYYATPRQAKIVRATALAGDVFDIENGAEGTDDVDLVTPGKTYAVSLSVTDQNVYDLALRGVMVNVTRFGANPNGGDSSQAVRDAIDSANGRCSLIFPSGTYDLENIEFPTNGRIIIRGAGRGITTLRLKAGAENPMFRRISEFMEHVEFHDLTVDGNEENIVDRRLPTMEIKAETLRIMRCEIKKTHFAGIYIRGIKLLAEISSCHFHSMAIHQGVTNEDAVAVRVTKDIADAGLSGVFWAHHNKFEATSPAVPGTNPGGIFVLPTDGTEQKCIIESNHCIRLGTRIAGNNISSIHIYRNGDGSIVRGNIIENLAADDGIRVQRSSNVLIDGNMVIGEDGTYGELSIADIGNGISVESRQPGLSKSAIKVRGNIVRGAPHLRNCLLLGFDGDPPEDAWCEDVLVEGNSFEDAYGGMRFRYCRGSIKIRGNIVRGTTEDDGTTFGSRLIYLQHFLGHKTNVEISGNDFIDNGGRVFLDTASPEDVYVQIVGNYARNCANKPGLNGSIFTVRNVAEVYYDGNQVVDIPSGASEMNFNDNGLVSRKIIRTDATWDPPNIAVGASASNNFTMTGAAFGDRVEVAAPYSIQGLDLQAWISASNTVTIRLRNNTGGAIDLASGNWTIIVKKGKF